MKIRKIRVRQGDREGDTLTRERQKEISLQLQA